MSTITPADVLDFWFGAPGSKEREAPRALWFERDDAFDALCRDRFLAAWEAASRGELDHWADDAEGAVALVVLLDQIPRNAWRNDARTFATDARALELSRRAIDRGLDRELSPLFRWFLYMPFMHAEDLAAQERGVELFESLQPALPVDVATYARRHRDAIARFGRFPHRNAVLGRESTADELVYLKDKPGGF
jgi:uncharacterized protein (DUF924 family)